MIYIKNKFSGDEFNKLEAAKFWMIPGEEEMKDALNPSGYLGANYENYREEFLEYVKLLKESKTLDELADIWNRYTDVFGNGSEFEVNEI